MFAFIAGVDGSAEFDFALARWAGYVAITSFAVSTVSATFLLGQLPSIRRRMGGAPGDGESIAPGADFYEARAWDDRGLLVDKFPLLRLIEFRLLATLEHWAFVAGILFLGSAIVLELAWG